MTPRTKLLILNSPNNPSGAVYPRADLEKVAALALEHEFYVVSDECYDALSYDGRVPSIAELSPEIKARTILVNTCSKAYAMTGWRLGFAAGPREIVKAMGDLQGQCTSNPTSIAQWAAVEALAGPQDEVAKMAGEFDQRRRVIVAGLNRIPGWRCPMPPGAFYAFPDVSGLFGRRFNGQPLARLDGRDDLPPGCGARRGRAGSGLRLRPAPPDLVRVRPRADPRGPRADRGGLRQARRLSRRPPSSGVSPGPRLPAFAPRPRRR